MGHPTGQFSSEQANCFSINHTGWIITAQHYENALFVSFYGIVNLQIHRFLVQWKCLTFSCEIMTVRIFFQFYCSQIQSFYTYFSLFIFYLENIWTGVIVKDDVLLFHVVEVQLWHWNLCICKKKLFWYLSSYDFLHWKELKWNLKFISCYIQA